jgi:hypothetical protein
VFALESHPTSSRKVASPSLRCAGPSGMQRGRFTQFSSSISAQHNSGTNAVMDNEPQLYLFEGLPWLFSSLHLSRVGNSCLINLRQCPLEHLTVISSGKSNCSPIFSVRTGTLSPQLHTYPNDQYCEEQAISSVLTELTEMSARSQYVQGSILSRS